VRLNLTEISWNARPARRYNLKRHTSRRGGSHAQRVETTSRQGYTRNWLFSRSFRPEFMSQPSIKILLIERDADLDADLGRAIRDLLAQAERVHFDVESA
jgi:hypothetical protein